MPYPWRVRRGPYKAPIAKVLLKRTTRQAVERGFLEFISRFSDIYAVYRAPLEELADALKHLGLYR